MKIFKIYALLFLITACICACNVHNTNKKYENRIIERLEIKYGMTLWDLAEEYKGEDEDIRQWIYEVKKLNNRQSSSLYAGETLLVFSKI